MITPCASRIPANPPTRVTNTYNFTDPKLVGYKLMRGSRIFFQGGGGGGPCPTARNGQRIYFLSST